MSGGGGGRKAAVTGGEEAEVEALLRAAQDAVMLKLQANSHLVSSSSSATAPNLPPSLDHPAAAAAADPLDADLARRFDALRSHRPLDPNPKQPDAPSAAAAGGMDELEARFAALKGAAGPEKETRVRLEDLGGESDEDEDDEVDKVMRWAMDAARLDVATAGAGKAKSTKKDDEEEEEEKDQTSSSVSSEDEEEEEEEKLEKERERKRKEMMSKNKSKTKWFSLF